MLKDLERFLPVVPAEAKESEEFNYFDFLQQTFAELKTGLETNGNTQKFREIQKERGQQILNYWRNFATLYQQAVADGKIENGNLLHLADGSEITIGIAQDYYRDDEFILDIVKRGDKERHEVSITISEDTGLDEFLHPPRIKSKFDREDDERKEYVFEIIFRQNKISTITKAILYIHYDFQLPWIKQVETLDTSSFGVESPILSQEN